MLNRAVCVASRSGVSVTGSHPCQGRGEARLMGSLRARFSNVRMQGETVSASERPTLSLVMEPLASSPWPPATPWRSRPLSPPPRQPAPDLEPVEDVLGAGHSQDSDPGAGVLRHLNARLGPIVGGGFPRLHRFLFERAGLVVDAAGDEDGRQEARELDRAGSPTAGGPLIGESRRAAQRALSPHGCRALDVSA